MTFEKAVEILGYNILRDVKSLKALTAVRKASLTISAPLKYKVACEVILNA